MALHPAFPDDPRAILDPATRWFPADEAPRDVPLKMAPLRQWCDINEAQTDMRFDYVFVDEEGFEKYRPASFRGLVKGFRDYKS